MSVKIATSILLSQKNIERKFAYRLVNCSLDIQAFENQMNTLKSNEQFFYYLSKNIYMIIFDEDWDDSRIINAYLLCWR